MATVITTSEDQDKAYTILEKYNEGKKIEGSHYYISVGQLHRMFTLWRFNTNNEGRFIKENYIKNLSTDIVKAVESAIERIGDRGLFIQLDMDEVLAKRDLEAFETGKYAGEKIIEVARKDPGYILFIINKMEEEFSRPKSHGVRNLSKKQILIYSLKGEMIAYFAEKRAERLRGSKHLGQIGDKVSIKVKFDRQNSFESNFGWETSYTYINTFLDEEGDVIIYKGKSLQGEFLEHMTDRISGEEFRSDDKIFNGELFNMGIRDGIYHTFLEPTAAGERTERAYKVADRLKSMDLGNITATYVTEDCSRFYYFDYADKKVREFEIGKEYIITGTIKSHDEYRGIKQTIIQRAKLQHI